MKSEQILGLKQIACDRLERLHFLNRRLIDIQSNKVA